jgi:hypothetical protein
MMRALSGTLFAAALLLTPPLARAEEKAKPTAVPLWTRYEAALTATKPLTNAFQEVDTTVELTSPAGKVHQVLAFWDGEQTFRFRFAPDETGTWQWRTRSTRADDPGLHGRTGTFTAVPYKGKNPLYRHGALRLSDDRHYMVHADGTPFFFLADTAWNGPMKADAASWDRYLRNRAAKRFNVIQFVTTNWRAAAGNADGRPAYVGREQLTLDAPFFRWMDARVDAINEHGLVAAPVAIWAIAGAHGDLNPGSLPDDQVIKLARYIVARYGAHHVVWFLAGDGEYRGEAAERWRKIGRAVFGDQPPARLVTMHPGGQKWVADEFRQEPWFTFNGYQSGHYNTTRVLNFLLDGGLTKQAGKSPVVPHINLEPSYELHGGAGHGTFNGLDVRRASWWSVLLAPPAGITYGAHGVWSWELQRNAPMLHVRAGIARPWHEVLDVEGAVSMGHLHRFFSGLKWWTLRPAPDLLVDPPARTTPENFTVAARSEADGLAIVYAGGGGEVKLRADGPAVRSAEWFDPRSGARKRATSSQAGGARIYKAAAADRDWVLVIRTAAQTASR